MQAQSTDTVPVLGTIAVAATGAITGPAASEGIANATLKASPFLSKPGLHPQAMPIH